jgi:hypothetical protein
VAFSPDGAFLLTAHQTGSAQLWDVATRKPDFPMLARYLQAVACLKAGDAAGYRAVCAGMAERLPRGDPKLSHHEPNSAARPPSTPTPPTTGPEPWPGLTTPWLGWRRSKR